MAEHIVLFVNEVCDVQERSLLFFKTTRQPLWHILAPIGALMDIPWPTRQQHPLFPITSVVYIIYKGCNSGKIKGTHPTHLVATLWHKWRPLGTTWELRGQHFGTTWDMGQFGDNSAPLGNWMGTPSNYVDSTRAPVGTTWHTLHCTMHYALCTTWWLFAERTFALKAAYGNF